MYEDQVLQIDSRRHRVRLRGQEVALTATEFRLLTVLVDNAGIVMSIDRLLELVWGDRDVTVPNVRAYISSLRRKLEAGRDPDEGHLNLIQTVPEFGYRYNPPRAC